MLNHFKKSLTQLLASGKKRGETARVRTSLERLEERTMLSASRGMMAYNYGGPGFHPQSGPGLQKFGSSAAFAPQQAQQQPVSYASQPFTGVVQSGAAYRSLQSQRPIEPAFQSPPLMNVGQQWSSSREYSHPYQAEPVTVSRVTYYVYDPHYNALTTVTVDYVYANARDSGPPASPPNPGSNGTSLIRALGLAAQPGGTSQRTGDYSDPRQFTQQDDRPPLPPIDLGFRPNGTYVPLGNVLASIVSKTSDLPSAPQILSRESTAVALNSVAREVAFQELTFNLFQPSAAAAYDRMDVDALGREAGQLAGDNLLLRPTDESAVDVAANSSDAVAREREAVDAVLEELHDIDLLSPTAEVHDLASKADLRTEAGLDELPAGEVDGGMVLLKSTGDAHGSGFDLTQVYADQVARFRAPVKMETSVGMLQAIDVATDEAPMTEPASRNESTSALKPAAQNDEQMSTKQEQKSSTKSAAVVGAAMVAGALVWLNRSGSRPDEKKSTAQKRRACRS